jgi:hypothetical protein
MADSFSERPILNSPYEYPGRRWELDAEGQPTHKIDAKRRESRLITPAPKPHVKRHPELTPWRHEELTPWSVTVVGFGRRAGAEPRA